MIRCYLAKPFFTFYNKNQCCILAKYKLLMYLQKYQILLLLHPWAHCGYTSNGLVVLAKFYMWTSSLDKKYSQMTILGAFSCAYINYCCEQTACHKCDTQMNLSSWMWYQSKHYPLALMTECWNSKNLSIRLLVSIMFP